MRGRPEQVLGLEQPLVQGPSEEDDQGGLAVQRCQHLTIHIHDVKGSFDRRGCETEKDEVPFNYIIFDRK